PVLSGLPVKGGGKYRYDALYRLVYAEVREHPGQQVDDSEPPTWSIPHGNDLQALEAYREEISYDEVGNILQMRHLRGVSNSASWSRKYNYAANSNRLLGTSIPGDPDGTFSASYSYDAHGSMTSM